MQVNQFVQGKYYTFVEYEDVESSKKALQHLKTNPYNEDCQVDYINQDFINKKRNIKGQYPIDFNQIHNKRKYLKNVFGDLIENVKTNNKK